jgi:hypothetical protein
MSKPSVSRRRARRAGLLATLVAALLTPAGTIIAGSATAALALGAIVAGKHHDEPPKTGPRAPALHAPVAHGGASGIVIESAGEMLQVALHDTAPGGLPQGAAPNPTAPALTGSGAGAGGPSGMPRAGQTGPHGAGPHGAGPIPPGLITPGPGAHPTPAPGGPAHPPTRKSGETDTPQPPADSGSPPKNSGHDPAQSDPKADSGPDGEPPVAAGPPRPKKPAQDEGTQDDADGKNDPAPGRTPDPLLPVGTLPDTGLPGDTLPDHAQPGHPSAQHVAAVPEPSVIGLLLLGAAALALSRRRTTVRRA